MTEVTKEMIIKAKGELKELNVQPQRLISVILHNQ